MSLLKRVQGGNPDAWTRFVRLYGPLLSYWCQQAAVDRADCPDLCQDILLRVSKSIGTFVKARPEDTLRGWLFTLTRHRIAEYYTARNRRAEVPLVGDAPWADRLARLQQEEESPEANSRRLLVQRILELLRADFTESTWQAFLLLTVEELSAPEVGSRLGMTAQAVRQARARVLRRLRAEFGELL